jgi:hypothetical protein
MSNRLAALITAALAGGLLALAACAPARAASASPVTTGVAEADAPVPADTAFRPVFEVVGRATPVVHRSNRWVWITAIAGAALVGASFPLADEADRRYDAYLAETDLARIDDRFAATERMDRLASGSLLAGEGLLAVAVWMRFVRAENDDGVPLPQRVSARQRVSLDVRTGRCALAIRF